MSSRRSRFFLSTVSVTETVRPAVVGLALAVLSGCGGVTSDLGNVVGLDQGQNPRGTGIFRDSNVSGLDYASGELSGVTAAEGGGRLQGSFEYEIGAPVTFSIGNLSLGTADLGGAFLTPVDLVGNGTTNRREVQNIARLLMMLDEDNNPGNGIAISNAVRAAAANWQQVDFGAVEAAFLADLVPIVSDVASVDNRTPELPDAIAAKSHLDSTLYCSWSGAFYGSFSDPNEVIGRFGITVNPLNGTIGGNIYRTAPETRAVMTSLTPLRFDGQNINAVSVSGSTQPDGDVFTFQFTSLNQIDGNWNNTRTSGTGTFTGLRMNDNQSPAYRFVGTYTGDDSGVFSFGVTASGGAGDAPDSANGETYSVVNGGPFSLSGRITGQGGGDRSIFLGGNDVKNYVGEINLETLTVSGTWEQNVSATQTDRGTFTGRGCRLN